MKSVPAKPEKRELKDMFIKKIIIKKLFLQHTTLHVSFRGRFNCTAKRNLEKHHIDV